MPFDESQFGAYIPTTDVIDPSELAQLDVQSTQLKNLLTRIRQNINSINLLLNIKDTGLYVTTEFVCGQLYFSDPALTSVTAVQPAQRNVFRKVINFGALPAAGTKSVAHGITFSATTKLTRLYAAASDPAGISYLPIPYASSVLANNIELNADAANVNITVGVNRSAYTNTFVIIEYLQN